MGIKSFDLNRKEKNRDMAYKDILQFDLDEILGHFNDEIREIKGLSDIAAFLQKDEKKDKAEHIWRAQIVFLVSALDYYMHGLTRYGLSEMYEENWTRSGDYKKLKVNIAFVEEALEQPNAIDWFLKNIVENYRKKSMGSYESIERQLELLEIDIAEVANAVFKDDNVADAKSSLETSLNKLYESRNIIAHQSSRSHETAEIKKLKGTDVTNYIKRVEGLVKAIDAEARKK